MLRVHFVAESEQASLGRKLGFLEAIPTYRPDLSGLLLEQTSIVETLLSPYHRRGVYSAVVDQEQATTRGKVLEH